MAKRYWETLLKDKDEDAPTSWWLKLVICVGFLIGIGIVVFIAGALLLFSGWGFSLLWNYSVSPLFDITEIEPIQATVLLFLIIACARFIKFLIKN